MELSAKRSLKKNIYRHVVIKLVLLLFLFIHFTVIFAEDSSYKGSSVYDVWNIVTERPYDELPNHTVTFGSFFSWGTNRLRDAANRTINSQEDILPPFKKLLHPNGICLLGKWKIDADNEYTGYFKSGSEGIIIARASVALSETTKGNYRGFGLAGKIFPVYDDSSKEVVKTANFFTVDDLTGTLADHYTDATQTNEPSVTFRLGSIGLAPVAAAAATALSSVDLNPGIRQLYEISELGLTIDELKDAKTPIWMKIEAADNTIAVNELDFRDELREQIRLYGEVNFKISVAKKVSYFGQKNWKTIGRINFYQAVASEGCDTRLHFHHPKFRIGLK
ncbi:MAG: hypothetical protein HQK49_23020 [Oligoflexia bacterium]|nr:hypothetical protein [Oligoflexia bacterium]